MARYDRAGEQLFDDSGNPLVDGLIDFFKSGSTDEADRIKTFSDPDQKIPNSNPVILSAAGKVPPIFYDGQANVVIRTAGGTQVEAKGTFPSLAATGTAFAGWDALVTYESDQIVIGSDGRFYLSILSVNLGNDPTTTSGKWQEIRFVDVYDAAETYNIGRIAIATDSNLYISRINENINNEPSVSPTEWKILTSATSVGGPISSTDNAIVRWDGTAGNLTQDSSVLIDDADNITGVGNLTATGLVQAATGLFGAALPGSPDGTFHIHSGSAGAVTAGSGANELVLESAGDCGMTLFSPDANFTQLQFGSIGDTIAAVLRWKFTLNQIELGTSRSGASVVLSADILAPNLTISGAVGSELATFTREVKTSILTVALLDNTAIATSFAEGANNYLNFDTKDGTENILFGNAVTNPDYIFSGSGLASFAGTVTVADGMTVTAGDLTLSEGKLTITDTANESALKIVSSATTISVIDLDFDSLVTGNGIDLRSNSASINGRALFNIVNENSAAVGATLLTCRQDAAIQVFQLTQNALSSYIDFSGAPAANVNSPISTFTTSGAILGHVQIEINGVKGWFAHLADPSA